MPRAPDRVLLRALLAGLLLALALCGGACRSPFADPLAEADQAYGRGDYFQAQRLYESYLQAQPQGGRRWEAWNKLLDIAALLENDNPKAAQLLEAMLLEFGEDPGRTGSLRLRLARVYTDMSQWDKAQEAWQALLAVKEGRRGIPDWEIQWNMGKIYQFQGKYAQARESMTHCRDLAEPGQAKARCTYDLALANTFLGQKDQARQWLAEVMAEPGAEAETKAMAGYLLSEILEADGKTAEARDVLLSIKDDYPNPKAVEMRLKRLGE